MLKQKLKTTVYPLFAPLANHLSWYSGVAARRLAWVGATAAGTALIVAVTANTQNYEAFAVTAAQPTLLSSRSVPATPTDRRTGTVSSQTESSLPATTGSVNNSASRTDGRPAAQAATVAPGTPSRNTRSTASPTPVPAESPAPAPNGTWKYPLHTGIRTTWFYAGELASPDNGYIQNVSSAWQENWQSYYGGSDDPTNRCGYAPCGFTPRENPFYFALPFSDFTTTGPVADLSMVYWYDGTSRATLNAGQSILKNRWIQITATIGGVTKTVYAQWEDVGPFREHDGAYVFGTAAPSYPQAGLDISPAARDYLGMGGSATTSWRFVDTSEVPAGPWKTTITSTGPDWN